MEPKQQTTSENRTGNSFVIELLGKQICNCGAG